MVKQKKPTIKQTKVTAKIYEESRTDLNHIKYSLKLKSQADVIAYLISEEEKRYDKM